VLLTVPIRDILPATPRARIVRLDLGAHAFPYKPGQAVTIAGHGRPKRIPYSIAAAPEDAAREHALELLIGVGADGRPGAHLDLELHEKVDIEGPLGAFTFPERPSERRFLFIAGGLGIAPLRAMLRHALRIEGAQIAVLYSARTPDDFAYERELHELAASGAIDFRQTVTRADASSAWRGGRGRIGASDMAPLIHDPETLCFVCGPPALVAEIPRRLQELGIARDRIKLEEW